MHSSTRSAARRRLMGSHQNRQRTSPSRPRTCTRHTACHVEGHTLGKRRMRRRRQRWWAVGACGVVPCEGRSLGVDAAPNIRSLEIVAVVARALSRLWVAAHVRAKEEPVLPGCTPVIRVCSRAPAVPAILGWNASLGGGGGGDMRHCAGELRATVAGQQDKGGCGASQRVLFVVVAVARIKSGNIGAEQVRADVRRPIPAVGARAF